MAFGGKIMALSLARTDDPTGAVREGLHDLNNQLALVIGCAELLAATPSLPDEARDLIALVVSGAEQAARVAADLQGIVRAAR